MLGMSVGGSSAIARCSKRLVKGKHGEHHEEIEETLVLESELT